MHSPKFLSVQDCVEWLPENERLTTLVLRELILETLPGVTEKLSYNVPYYFGRKSICFLWPGAVQWGKKRMYDGVRMGITHASALTLDSQYFKLDHRKHVGFHDFVSVESIDPDEIQRWLLAAHQHDAS